ncbi:MAG: L-threonine synthase, partial [Desulfurococcaceae archaeon]
MIVLKKDIYWICNCGFRENAWLSYYWKCPVCGKPLNLDYEKRFEPVGGRGLARYSSMLPFSPIKTRGEES